MKNGVKRSANANAEPLWTVMVPGDTSQVTDGKKIGAKRINPTHQV